MKNEEILKHIAAVVHSGGLLGLDSYIAACVVRRLTVGLWDKTQTEEEQRLAVANALRATERIEKG